MNRVLALPAVLFLGALNCAESANRPGEGEPEFAHAARVYSLVDRAPPSLRLSV